jgi:hypothetical protein
MLTVNSPLRLMNSLVPSSGSTSQKVRPTAVGLAARGHLLGHHRNARRQRAQRRHDEGFGALVGFGHGRRVGLAAHVDGALVDGHHDVAGIAHDAHQGFDVRHGWGSRSGSFEAIVAAPEADICL